MHRNSAELREKRMKILIAEDDLVSRKYLSKVLSNYETQEEITADKRVKIIMTTALGETQVIQTSFDYGCDAYASKPIDVAKMIDVMRKIGLDVE